MKKFSKVFAFAALAALMASCSQDDLNVGAQFRADKAQLFGTIGGEKTTRTGMFEPTGYLSDRVVWTEGDKARVFTLDALTYHAYNLVDGAGTQTGTFTATSATTLTGKKYAVTDASMVYAVSAADESGNALLTMTIPSSYSVNEEMMGEGIYKFPAPFWGEATEEEKGTDADGNKLYDLTVGFKALVHYLRVDLADIPTGTKAIVLTTHGEDGYQLASKLPTDDKVWKAPTEESISSGNPDAPADWSAIPFTTGGASEALSGTVNTVLEEGCFLHVDEQNRLVYSDTLRIDLAEIQRYLEVDPRGQAVEVEQNTDQVFWVPILVNTYKNLRVLAVTEDSRFSYCWVGKELACYSDKYFDRSGITDLMQKNVEVPDEVNCRELSEIIREAADGMHTAIVNVKELNLSGDDAEDKIYIEDEFVKNNVVLNIEKIDGDDGDGFQIVEASYLPNADYDPLSPYGPNAQYLWKPVLYNRNPDAAERTIEVNLPSEYDEDVNIDTPTSNVEIGTIDKANGLANIKVLAASTKFVSGHDVAFNDSRVLQNYKDASVIVKTGMGSVEIAEGSVGDVYFYSGGQEEAETEKLTVTTVNGIAIRISDALIEDIYMMPTSRQERFILTTGSAAFKTLKVHPDATTQNPNLNNVDIQSYWTGAALSEYALENGYDQKEVWTVAQLASVGEGAPSTYTEGEYEIPTLVTEMWLGDSEYPWIGAEVTVDNFKFNGNGVSLQNMTLDTNDATFVDPHHCCTSCGPARKMNLEENLGLFRSINNTESLVENIDLNDVYLKTDAPIDHIGSIVGYVNNDKAQFKNNIIGEVKIDVNGFGVGGMAGAIETKELLAKDNEVTGVGDNDYQPLASGYVISKKSLVGGLIGYAVVEGKADILNTTIKFDDPTATDPTNQIYTEGSCAGGVIGGLSTSGASSIKNANVKVRDKIAADGLSKDYYQVAYDILNGTTHPILPEQAFTNGEYQFFDFEDWDQFDAVAPIAGTQIISCAGGVAGNIESADNIIIMNSKVDVDNEISGNGSFIGGLAAVSSSQKYTRIQDNEVKTALLESYERGTVGGSVGALYSKEAARNLNNKATITNIMANGSSFASGQIGILGTGGHAFVDGNEVNVSGQIYANNQVAAGLIGVSNVFTEGKKLTVLDGKVNVGTIKSENGYAGGAAAVLLNGKSYFGNKDVNLSSKNNRGDSYTPEQYAYTLDIDVATLASAYAVGGIVGKNNPEMYVYTQKWQYSSDKKYGAEVDVDIVKYENTKDESWFATSTDWNKLGTFGNILGYQDAKIDYWTPELHVTNKLDDAMKKAVLYPNHRDRDHTTIIPNMYYWGDSNDSNVGWASNSGLYYKDGVKVQRGDQYNGFNKYCKY